MRRPTGAAPAVAGMAVAKDPSGGVRAPGMSGPGWEGGWRWTVLAAFSALLWSAEGGIPGPWALRAGLSVANEQVRTLVGDQGWYLGAGVIVPQRGLVGRIGGDLDWRATAAGADRADALSATYIERHPLSGGVYAGLGAGVSLIRIRQPTWVAVSLRPTAKGVVGATLPWTPPVHGARMGVEAAGFLSDRLRGVATHGITVAAVVGF